MMMEENEGQSSGETTETAPESHEPSQTASRSDVQTQEAKPTEDTSKLPFNDPRSPHHDRFKELMDQRNEERNARSSLEQKIRDMESKWEKANKPAPAEDAVVKKLMAIDPEFAKDYQALKESQSKVTPELDQLRAWKQEAEQKAVKAQYESTVSKLHSDNKVTPALQSKYAMELEARIRANPNMRMEDVPKAYKEIHDEYTALFSARDKAATETYLKGKRADAGVAPGQSKGKAPVASGDEFTGNKEQDRALLIQKVLKMNKASNGL